MLRTPWDTAQLHAVAAEVYAANRRPDLAAWERARALAINPHAFQGPAALKVFN